MRKDELQVLATAGGAKTKSDGNWLPVAELRNSMMQDLEPCTEVGFNQKCVLTCVVFVTEFECKTHGAMRMQGDARRCKMMQDNVRHCKRMQDDAKMMQDDARQSNMIEGCARRCKMMCYFQNNTK